MQETHKRSVVKGISWRLAATFMTMVISYLITRRIDLALEIGVIEFIAKVFLYYLHERAWLKLRWGRK